MNSVANAGTPECMGPIVVTTDFSPTAEPGLATAAGVARVTGAPLHLVHVWTPPSLPAVNVRLAPTRERAAHEEADRRGALAALVEQHGAPDVHITPHLLEGEVAPEVARYARAIGAAMIVIGTSAPTGVRAVLLGSVADQIARTAPCPVLVVRAGPPAEEI